MHYEYQRHIIFMHMTGSWNNLDADFGSWMLDFASLDCTAWISGAGDGLVAISQCLFHSAREQNIYRRQFLL
jgi:hypothetical protein